MDLQEYFTAPPLDKLFHHYTSVDTLLNIAKEGTLRAGHVAYMNDSMELKHASKMLRKALEPTVSFRPNSDEAMFFVELQDWVDAQLESSNPCFVFSLSERESLLSQWRSYTKPGKGVSIGFTTARLLQIGHENGFQLGQCIYDESEQLTLMLKVAMRLYDTYVQVRLSPTQDFRHGLFETHKRDIFLTLALAKDYTFAEEAEWRLIAFNKHNAAGIKYREGPFMLTPYVELDLKKAGPGKQIFDTVMLGPTQHQELALSAARSYLQDNGLCPNVAATDIPFRHG